MTPSSNDPADTPTSGATVSERAVRLFSLVTLFVIGTDTFLTAPLLPLLQRQFGVSTAQSGWLVSSYAFGYALSALVAGPISDRLNRRSVLLAGLVGFTVFSGACGLTWDFWSLFTARMLAGVSAAFVTPQIWASIPVLVAPSAIITTMGYATAGLAIAQVAGIPLASYLSAWGWQLPFFVTAAASILLWLLLHATFPTIRPAAGGGGLMRPYAEILHSRPLTLSLVAYMVFHTGNFCALSFTGSWLARDFGADQRTIGTAMIIIGLGNAVGSLGGARFFSRLGQQRSLILGMLALGLAYLGTILASGLWAAVLILAMAMMIGGFLFPVLMGQLQGLTSSARGTVSSLSSAAMYGGSTIAGAVGGTLLSEFRGYQGVAVFTFLAYLASLAVYALAGAFSHPTNA